MKARLDLVLGGKRLLLEYEGESKDIIKTFAFWSGLPTKCGLCKGSDISLHYKNPKSNDYYGLKCLTCSAEYNFGQNKTGGTLFMKREPWKVWQGEIETNGDEA